MKKIIVLIIVFASWFGVSAQTASTIGDINPALDDIIRSYLPWQSAEFNGKLKMDGLPISPTIKMYMEKDSLIQISVRASILGEVARIDLTRGNILVVNKMKRTYLSESTDNLMQAYPGLISDLQSLFLARVTVLGEGQLDYTNYNVVELQDTDKDLWKVIPATDGLSDLGYWYLVNKSSRTQSLNIELPGTLAAEIDYAYANRGMRMDFNIDTDGKKIELGLDFSSVKWGGSRMAPANLNNYTRQDIKTFVKSFM